MAKRALCLLLALAAVFSLAAPALAEAAPVEAAVTEAPVAEPDDVTTQDDVEAQVDAVIAGGSYMQTAARSMLAQVNAFRTGSDAWYWNEANDQKVRLTGLEPLTYDHALEQIAMRRAAELAIRYSHIRPDGTGCFTLTYDGVQSWAENIAYGYPSVQAMFDGWAEADQPYNGQGHRRSMLSYSYTAIGIACFYYNGTYYWVQEFGQTNSGIPDPQPELAVSSGKLPSGLDWRIENGALTISGAGSMGTIRGSKPWNVETVTSVTMEKGVLDIVYGAFDGCTSLTDVTILNPVCELGSGRNTLGVPGRTVIHGYTDSTAQAYAEEYGYTFKTLGKAPQLAAPTVTIAPVSDGIKVTWNAIEGSPRYMVYYKENNSGWKQIGTTTATTYTRAAKYLKNGATYAFTVRCCDSDKKTMLSGYKASSSLKYTVSLTAPTVKIAKVSGGIQVSWNKISGSPRYMVYYKENNSGWKQIGTTTATSYTRAAKYLKNGATYAFTVRCCDSDKKTMLSGYKASNSLKYTVTLAAPKLKSAVSTDGGVLVRWEAVTGAEAYRVFCKTAGGQWTAVADVPGSKTEYTWAGARDGTTYAFTVRCIDSAGKTYTSAYDTTGVTVTYVQETAKAVDSGVCGDQGDNVKWTLTEDGTLTISGTGKMKDYSQGSPAPWAYYLDIETDTGFYFKANQIVVKSGVTSIGDYAFYAGSGNALGVSLPASVTRIGEMAFYGWSNFGGTGEIRVPDR